MSFISYEYVTLLLVCFAAFYLTKGTARKIVLLAASCVMIGYYHWLFLAVAVFISLFTYGAGHLISAANRKGRPQAVYWTSIVCLVLFWIGFRYADKLTGGSGIIFPLGMSFYTFQAISYLTEVYWEEQPEERNLLDFLLYMLLFMKFISGPIERPGSLLPQIKDLRAPSYETMTYGMKLILVGLVKKLALADHIAPYIDSIFNSIHSVSGVQLLMACLLYPIDLYADFSGYTDIAIGCAMLFGLRLTPNFDRPFAAQTTTDLWRRWHISLSSWVRDYLFMPLTSLTRGLGRWGVELSLLLTFVALGIWHGAGWAFVIYGLIQGVIIVWEMKTQAARKAVSQKIGHRLYGFLAAVRTYLLFAVSLVFFKTGSTKDSLYFLSHLSFKTLNSWKEINIGMPDHICIVAGAALLLVILYEYGMSRLDLHKWLSSRPAALRWAVYYLLVFAVLAYGKLGAENFIYFQF